MSLTASLKSCKGCEKSFAPSHQLEAYCSKRCRRKYAARRQRARDRARDKTVKTQRPRHCKWCQSSFTGPATRRYCSEQCKSAASAKYRRDYMREYRRKINNPTEQKQCEYCRSPFETNKTHKLYCSATCQLASNGKAARSKRNGKRVPAQVNTDS